MKQYSNRLLAEWREVPNDPSNEDLGYEIQDLEVAKDDEIGGRMIFDPSKDGIGTNAWLSGEYVVLGDMA